MYLVLCLPLILCQCNCSVVAAKELQLHMASKGDPVKEPQKVTIKEGETVIFKGKKEVRFSNLRGVIYSHLADSKNHSMCAVTIEAGGTKKDITFERESPGDLQYQKFEDLEIALEGVDPYHQPSSAWFLVREQ